MAINVLQGPIIRAGEALSDPLNCRSGQLVRIHMPTDWSPKTAPLTFQISIDGITWFDLYDMMGTEVVVLKVVPNSAALIQHQQVREAWVRFRSGWRANPKPQDAERVFTVVVDAVKPGGGPNE